MKRLAVILLVVLAACGPPKDTLELPAKCNMSATHTWRYSHTIYWTTQEPIYGYRYNWYSGEYEWGQTGTETIHHERDIYACMTRR
jgi:hypothetical protein